MRRDTIIFGLGMLLAGVGIGYVLAMEKLMFRATDLMNTALSNSSEIHVQVLAKQYSWHFHYPGDDGRFGATAPTAMTKLNPLGLNPNDPASKDDLHSSVLVLPCKSSITLFLTSADVIHSLGHFYNGIETDAIPGTEIPISLQSPSNPDSGTLRCVQLCGSGNKDHHAPYRFVGLKDFTIWRAGQEKALTPTDSN